jgi:hypothetical protein
MNHNEKFEFTILKEHLKILGKINSKIEKLTPPEPDFIVDNNIYYEVTFCSYDQNTAEIYHKIEQKIPLRLNKPLDIIENNCKLINSIMKTIEKKKRKYYSIQKQKEFNLLIRIYHGPNFDYTIFETIKTKVKDMGQYRKIYLQTGFGTEVIQLE